MTTDHDRPAPRPGISSPPDLAAAAVRGGLFAAIWWILSDGVPESWLIGAPVVLAATITSMTMLPASAWSLRGIVAFVPIFLWQSIRGGIDVARIVLDPRLPLSPAVVDYRLRLPPGMPRVFMVNAVNLLPGTLSSDLRDDVLRVHALDENAAIAADMARLEQLIVGVFGLGKATGAQGGELATTASRRPTSPRIDDDG